MHLRMPHHVPTSHVCHIIDTALSLRRDNIYVIRLCMIPCWYTSTNCTKRRHNSIFITTLSETLSANRFLSYGYPYFAQKSLLLMRALSEGRQVARVRCHWSIYRECIVEQDTRGQRGNLSRPKFNQDSCLPHDKMTFSVENYWCCAFHWCHIQNATSHLFITSDIHRFTMR